MESATSKERSHKDDRAKKGKNPPASTFHPPPPKFPLNFTGGDKNANKSTYAEDQPVFAFVDALKGSSTTSHSHCSSMARTTHRWMKQQEEQCRGPVCPLPVGPCLLLAHSSQSGQRGGDPAATTAGLGGWWRHSAHCVGQQHGLVPSPGVGKGGPTGSKVPGPQSPPFSPSLALAVAPPARTPPSSSPPPPLTSGLGRMSPRSLPRVPEFAGTAAVRRESKAGSAQSPKPPSTPPLPRSAPAPTPTPAPQLTWPSKGS